MLLVPAVLLMVGGCADDTTSVADPSPAPASTPAATPATTPAGVEPTSAPPAPEPSDPTEPAEPTGPAEPGPIADDPSQPVQSYEAALARFDTFGQEPQDEGRFQTPDGIYCLLDSDFVQGCELNRGGIPAPEFCGEGPSQSVGRIERTGSSFEPVCNSDTIREPGAPKLAFDSIGAGASGLMCLAQSIGVTCIDRAAEQGFFLSASQYEVF